MTATVGLLHPGDMGSMVGACAVAVGSRVTAQCTFSVVAGRNNGLK